MMQENNIDQEPRKEEPLQPPVMPTPPINTPPQKPRVRRVGTLTMGVALIVTGLALTTSLLMPNVDIMLIIKLAPLVLVALGLEIFISACFSKSEKIKYDGLSIFMCLLLIFGSFTASLVPTVLMYAGPQRSAAMANVEREIEDILFDNRDKIDDIYDVQISVNFNELRKFTGDETVKDLTASDYVYAYITLNGEYKTAEEFAKAAKPTCDLLLGKVSNVRKIEVSMRDNQGLDKKFSLMLRGRFHAGMSAEELVKLVDTSYYNADEGYYMNQEDYDRWQKDREQTAEQPVQEETAATSDMQQANGTPEVLTQEETAATSVSQMRRNLRNKYGANCGVIYGINAAQVKTFSFWKIGLAYTHNINGRHRYYRCRPYLV
ncbi:MAG: hypothetical protein RR271_02415 [Oscillospiraceae bacterium]